MQGGLTLTSIWKKAMCLCQVRSGAMLLEALDSNFKEKYITDTCTVWLTRCRGFLPENFYRCLDICLEAVIPLNCLLRF
jgi:hypothetical protein